MPVPRPAHYINPAVGLETEQDVIDCIHMTTGDAYCGYQLLLLDRNLQPVPLPDPPNPDVPNDLMPFVMQCSVDVNADNEVARTMDLELEETPGLQLNTLKHRLQLRDVRYLPVGGKLVEALNIPQGVFGLPLADRSFLGDLPPTWDGTWQDPSSRIAGKQFWSDYVTPAGVRATDLLLTLMLMDPQPNSDGGGGQTPAGCPHVGIGWPSTLLDLTPSDLILPDPITFTWKTNSQLAALSQICTAINYWKPWNGFDGHESFLPNPYQYVDAEGRMLLPSPDWRYLYGRDSIYDGTVKISYPRMPILFNGIRILSQSNDRDPIESIIWNHSVESLTSVENYGDWLINTIEDDQIQDQATADGRARIELLRACMPEQQIEFQAHPNPFIDIHSMIGAEYKAPDGSFYLRVDTNPFEVTQMRLDLANRQQQITGLRVISLGPVSAD